MILGTITKQPQERKDYDVPYASWLAGIQDSLDEVSVTVACITDPLDMALLVDPDPEMTADTIKIWVSSGTSNYRYKVTLLVATVGGRVDESELIFKIKDF